MYSWYISLLLLLFSQLFILDFNNSYANAFFVNCIIRGAFPRVDITRICFLDGIFSSVIVGRTLATVGEIGLVYCVRDYLHKNLILCRKINRYSFWTSCSLLVISLINYLSIGLVCIAEVFSWLAVIHKNNKFHVTEELIWFYMGLFTFTLVLFFQHNIQSENFRKYNGKIVNYSFLYCIYMLLVDIPMYYNRWKLQEPPTDLVTGFGELWDCKKVSHNLNDFGLTLVYAWLYFGIAPYILDQIVFYTKRTQLTLNSRRYNY